VPLWKNNLVAHFIKGTVPRIFSNWFPPDHSWLTCNATGTSGRIKHTVDNNQKQCPCHGRNTMAIQLLREKNKLVKASAEN